MDATESVQSKQFHLVVLMPQSPTFSIVPQMLVLLLFLWES